MQSSQSKPAFKTRPWTLDGMIVNEVLRGVYTKYVQINPSDIVVDVGAHIGVFSIIASRTAAAVYAFEPQPENYQLLLENIAKNHAENITPLNMAITDSEGESYLKMDRMNTGGHTLVDNAVQDGWRVRTVSLDTQLPRVNFMKIDAEGSEIKVLRGASRLLDQFNVKIAMEVHGRDNLNKTIDLLANQHHYTIGWENYGLADLYLLWAQKEIQA